MVRREHGVFQLDRPRHGRLRAANYSQHKVHRWSMRGGYGILREHVKSKPIISNLRVELGRLCRTIRSYTGHKVSTDHKSIGGGSLGHVYEDHSLLRAFHCFFPE